MLADEKKRKVTIVGILEGILWNVQWIACNPEKDYQGKTWLFGYHLCTEVALMVLVVIDVSGRTLDLADFALTVMYFTVLAQTVMKLLGLYVNKDRFLKMIKTVKTFWTAETYAGFGEEFQSTLDLMNAAFNCYKFFFAVALIMHIIVPVYYREMIIFIWTPFDKKLLETSLPHLLVPAFFETITFGYTVWFSVIYSDCLFGLLMTGSILQFRMLQHAFKLMAGVRSDSRRRKLTIEFVEYHKVLYEFVEDVEAVFKYSIICQLMCAVFAICVSAFLFTDESVDLTNKLTFLSYVLCNVFEMFLYCAACQAVQTESGLVADAVYFSGWEDSYDLDLRIYVQFTIMRAQRETKISAWLVELSLELFVQVLQLSFSTFTLLQNTQEE